MTPPDEPRKSATHERAVLAQDNGELAEDVLSKDELDRGASSSDSATDGATSAYDRVDQQSKDSFPASDAPPSWSGDPHGADPDESSARVRDRSAVEHPLERVRPDDPVPKTLPADSDSGR